MRAVATAVAILIGLINITLFILWWSLIKITAGDVATDKTQYILNTLSLQVSVLQTVLAAIAIGLGILGIWGYAAIKEAALEKCLKASTEQTSRHLNTLKDKGELTSKGSSHPHVAGEIIESNIQQEGVVR